MARTWIILAWLVGATTGAVAATAAGDSAAVAVATAPRAIDTEAAWQCADAAWDLAARERHGQSARAFIDALNHDARLVGIICDDLAYQKLWNDETDKAAFYFRRYLLRHPGEANREARQGLALAYTWSGRQGQAIDLYRDLVAEDPADAGSRLGLGRALIWDNRLHEGFSVLHDLETDFAGQAPGRDAGAFLLTVFDEYDPHLDLRWTASWDSDDLDIQRLSARGRTNLGNVLVEAGGDLAWYQQPGWPDAQAPRLHLGAIVPLAHRWSLHAYGWVDHFTSDDPLPGGEPLDWTRPGGDAWLTWLATHRLRLDLGASSQPVETYLALAEKLHHELASLSADWRLAQHWTLAGVGQLGDYSDGNARRRGTVHLQWHRDGTWAWSAGPAFFYQDFDQPYPGGYWAPDWVRNLSLQAAVTRRWLRFVAKLDGSVGREKELGADALTVGGIHGHLGWRVSPSWLLSADLGYSRSSFSTASGYNRTAAGLSARALF